MHETCQIVTKLEGEIINFLILLDLTDDVITTIAFFHHTV